MSKRCYALIVTLVAAMWQLPAQPVQVTQGQWEALMDWSALTYQPPTGDPVTAGLQSVHAYLMKNGLVLFLDLTPGGALGTDVLDTAVFDPATGAIITAVMQQSPSHLSQYCAGGATLQSGELMLAGGGSGPPGHLNTTIYNPDQYLSLTQFRVDGPILPDPDPQLPIQSGRWYPTLTSLGDGKVLCTSGRHWPGYFDTVGGVRVLLPQPQDTPLLWDPCDTDGQPWTRLESQFSSQMILDYPYMFQLTNGKVFHGGAFWIANDPAYTPAIKYNTYLFDVALRAWSLVGQACDPVEGCFAGGTAVMYRPNQILKGSAAHHPEHQTRLTFTIDPTKSGAAWSAGPTMNIERADGAQFVSLPDGRVLVVGGGYNSVGGFVYAVEWWNPDDTNGWQTLAAQDRPRTYHSSALLLPDGRVFSGGGEWGGGGGAPIREKNAQIFRPPYLFNCYGTYLTPADREYMLNYPTTINYNTGFVISLDLTKGIDVDDISKVVLIRLGAATHGFDAEQRYVPLDFVRGDLSALSVAAPKTTFEAPAGYYMLFVTVYGDRTGIEYPSMGKIVHLPKPPCPNQ